MPPQEFQRLFSQRDRERQKREAARANLIDFATYCIPRYHADPAHCLIASELDDVLAGRTKRLAIFTPPQHGKSTLASILFPSYWLAKRPDEPVILASYSADLSVKHSQYSRRMLEGGEFAKLFPDIKTDQQSRAVNHWNIAGRYGSLKAIGLEGGITGAPSSCSIIDDPIEGWKEAQSESRREDVWNWYQAELFPRTAENGAIVLIMTLWHPDDIGCKLLRTGQWRVVRLPAIAETQKERDDNNAYLGLPTGLPDPIGRQPGEPLAPHRFSLNALNERKAGMSSIIWSGLYQCVPRAAEGNRFKRAWFKIVEYLPEGCQLVRYWDKAGTAGDGCFTVGLLMARTPGAEYIIVDMKRGQWGSMQRKSIMRATAEADHEKYGGVVQQVIEREPSESGKEAAEDDVRLLDEFPVYIDRVSKSKEIRAEPLAAKAEAGFVWLLRGPWNDTFLDRIALFPVDGMDETDAASGAYNKLARGGLSTAPTFVPQPGIDPHIVERIRGQVDPIQVSRAIFGTQGRPDHGQRSGWMGRKRRF